MTAACRHGGPAAFVKQLASVAAFPDPRLTGGAA
jgi:hypothetical protein